MAAEFGQSLVHRAESLHSHNYELQEVTTVHSSSAQQLEIFHSITASCYVDHPAEVKLVDFP